jgi:hypothetical protein
LQVATYCSRKCQVAAWPLHKCCCELVAEAKRKQVDPGPKEVKQEDLKDMVASLGPSTPQIFRQAIADDRRAVASLLMKE